MFPPIPPDLIMEHSSTPSEMLLVSSQYSSDSMFSHKLYNRIIEGENSKFNNRKLEQLKVNLGEDLFNQLSEKQKMFVISVAGSVSFGDSATSEIFKNDEYE